MRKFLLIMFTASDSHKAAKKVVFRFCPPMCLESACVSRPIIENHDLLLT